MVTCTECIWRDYREPLHGFIRSRVGDDATADDILQDVFARIHSRLDTLREHERIQSWIYQITRNAIIDHYRSYRPTEEIPDFLAMPEDDPSEKAHADIGKCVLGLMQDLPKLYRDALMLSEIEGLPQKEAAEKLGLSASGAKSRIQRARLMLKDLLFGCCHFEFDHQGVMVEYEPKKEGCGCKHC